MPRRRRELNTWVNILIMRTANGFLIAEGDRCSHPDIPESVVCESPKDLVNLLQDWSAKEKPATGDSPPADEEEEN